MKKFFVSIAVICTMLFFASCGDNSSDKKEDNTEKTDTENEHDGDTNDTDSDTGADTGADTGTETDTDTDTGSQTDTDSDTGADTGTETDTDTGTGDTDADTDTDTDTGDNAQLYEKFVGRWAAKVILHSNSVAANIPAPSITTRYFVVDFYVNDKGQLDMDKVDNILCSTENRTGQECATAQSNVLFNDSFFNTIFFHWKPYNIEGQENVPYVEVAKNGEEISFQLNKDYDLRGANMNNPATEDMIANNNDARIFDHDNDGKVAFTLGIKGKSALSTGTMYYVQRLWHVFRGTLVDENTIEGKVEWSDEQHLVDATNLTLKAPKNTVTDKEKSIFQFKKVAEDMDCSKMLEDLDTIFDIVDPNAGDAVGL